MDSSIEEQDTSDSNTTPLGEYLPRVVQYRVESSERQRLWANAWSICRSDTGGIQSTNCNNALDNYFLDEAVWDYAVFHIRDQQGNLQPSNSRINSRVANLKYGYDDYAIDSIPLWRDIFDGGLEQRSETFLHTTLNPMCSRLSDMSRGTVQPQLKDRCSARELYKYAIFLDACFTLRDRRKVIQNPHFPVHTFESFASTEEYSTNDGESLDKSRLKKEFLHTIWLAHRCSGKPMTLLPKTSTRIDGEIPSSFSFRPTDAEFQEMVSHAHDTALGIAVKSGDEWAIRSHPIDPQVSEPFKRYMLEHYPLLMHRHLGRSHFKGSPEGKRHLAKAYLLLEEMAGFHIAEDEFSDVHLRVEIREARQEQALEL